MNLVSNAIKFTEKGNVTISTGVEADKIYVAITDTGIGIRKQEIKSLFESFVQVSSGKGRKIGGTGLGLAISKKIIEQHGGKIQLESKYAKGSTFSFALPLERPPIVQET